MLPEPTLSFTLQSLHDNTPLDCRIYHPSSLAPARNAPVWRRNSAIFAHPYAPLGGSYNDYVVEAATEALLRQGYLVGTFNFRGASGSAGRTSWTAKPERSDYMSIVGFIVHYIHHLDPFCHRDESISRQPLDERDADKSSPTLILGGYSYGSMITSQLPPLPEIMRLFEAPALGSAAAEIRTRAKHLAVNQNAILSSVFEDRVSLNTSRPTRRSLGLRIGGSETVPHRKSHESRRSLSLEAENKIRKSFNEVRAKLTHKRSPRGSLQKTTTKSESALQTTPTPAAVDTALLEVISDLIQPRVAYLLVSPLQGIVTHFATMSFSLSSLLGRRASNTQTSSDASEGTEAKLWQHPTLAVYGDNDIFVPVAKLRAWKMRLSSMPNSKFVGQEVSGASHFWMERGSMHIVRMLIREFSASLVAGA